ncbi:ABC transporter substrate-binding protein [Bosea sp. SSUT16]|jgi:NitT/TauT family transport system substrate-binding protein|uniref:ABC transporter substrate-binding protein n=1 Tax=Bosea spartocytisi TaxID=2773451 RepID=A0A927HZW3_9HYPH|nr:ABC transporter substrate-binding protein [Bosea spartocytisi]MBD3845727.1 ABC transporter substrate-binding protein [Bosea spartocytisi]MCT4473020.1 ABC transporter substrate-binding protein [Bosea spartocytisi]
MTRLRFLAKAAFTAAFGLGLAAVPAAGIAQEAKRPKLDFAGSVTWLGMVPVLLAVDKGYFTEAGLDVSLQVVLNSSDRVRALTAGSVAFSNLGRTTVLSEMARGNTSFYYFANIDDSPGSEGCWARSGFKSFADLKGRKVAANTSAEITMAGLLAKVGLKSSDISYVNLPPNEMQLALSRGDVDAACIWQPILDGLKKAVPDGVLLGTDRDTDMFQRFGTMSAPDIMIISRKLVQEDPASAGKLAAAVMKAADFVNANPEETAKTVAHYFRQPPETVLAGIRGFTYYGTKDWPEHMRRHGAQMDHLAGWLAENGKIPMKPDVKAWENTSFVPKP